MKNTLTNIAILLIVGLSITYCAKRGRPTGGPVDEEPPVILRSVPDNFTTNFKNQKITITFNEFIKIKDLQKQLVVSPPLKQRPIITPQGGAAKKMTITIQDTLLENTTYTLNFGQSIVDNNEENAYPFYRYVFSTGAAIDSLELNGRITDALDFTVDEFVNVLLYEMDENYTDSIVYNGSPRYVINTLDSLTTFKMQNLKAGIYRMVALKDNNSNLKLDPSRDKVGFISDPITLPTSDEFIIEMYQPVESNQITRGSHQGKSKIWFPYTGTASEINIKATTAGIEKERLTLLTDKDTLQYWFYPELEVDTLSVNAIYDNEVVPIDIKLKDRYRDSLTLTKVGDFSLRSASGYAATTPIDSIDDTRFLLLDRDSAAVDFSIQLDSLKNSFTVDFNREENQSYKLSLLPGAVIDFYGETNDTILAALNTRSTTEYGNMMITLNGGKEFPAIIQIITEEQEVVLEKVVRDNGSYDFNNLDPGNYFVRIIYDNNDNGRYDPGNFLKNIQPEKVVYLPEIKKLQANWDLRETINLE